MKDWTGNAQAVHAINLRNHDAQEHDYYATDPRAWSCCWKTKLLTAVYGNPRAAKGI